MDGISGDVPKNRGGVGLEVQFNQKTGSARVTRRNAQIADKRRLESEQVIAIVGFAGECAFVDLFARCLFRGLKLFIPGLRMVAKVAGCLRRRVLLLRWRLLRLRWWILRLRVNFRAREKKVARPRKIVPTFARKMRSERTN